VKVLLFYKKLAYSVVAILLRCYSFIALYYDIHEYVSLHHNGAHR